jgi:hypothetical protein
MRTVCCCPTIILYLACFGLLIAVAVLSGGGRVGNGISEKIPRKRHGTVSLIPRKKALIPRHSEFRGRANSEARNRIPSCVLFRRK